MEPAGREPQKWAVIIGVGAYEDLGLSKLPNAVNDAKALCTVLVRGGQLFPEKNVVLMTDDAASPLHRPTKNNIMAILGRWIEQAYLHDTVLVYFAGHGVDYKGSLYLMPLDARMVSIEQSAIAYKDFELELGKSASKLSIMILDACHSGTGRAVESMTHDTLEDLKKYSEGHMLLASCSEDEVSHEIPRSGHGAFTYYLIEGLRGAADSNRDQLVSAKELSDYTYDYVNQWSRRNQLKQTPRLLANISGDIYLAKSQASQPVNPEVEKAMAQIEALLKVLEGTGN